MFDGAAKSMTLKKGRKGEQNMSAETAEVSREQQLKERAERKSLWRAKLQVRKMKNLTDPTSIVIVPRSAGGHNLTKVLFGFDKVIHKMRVDGGLGGVKVGKVTEGIVMIQEFKGQLKELAGAITSMAKYPSNAMYDMHESPEHKKILAHTSGSYVIVPSTNDTKEIGQLIKRIEAALTVVNGTCQ